MNKEVCTQKAYDEIVAKIEQLKAHIRAARLEGNTQGESLESLPSGVDQAAVSADVADLKRLRSRLDRMVAVSSLDMPPEKIGIGSRVKVLIDGEEMVCLLDGVLNGDPETVTAGSDLGKALMGLKPGSQTTYVIEHNGSRHTLEVVSIEQPSMASS